MKGLQIDSRVRLLGLFVLAIPLMTGCSLLWPANRAPLEGGPPSMDGGDGGLDAGLDGSLEGGPDAGPDAGPLPVFETECNNNIDDDGDGLLDCTDFDCSADFGCCQAGSEWPIADYGDWTAQPQADTERPVTDGNRVQGFGPNGVIRSLRHSRCLPLGLGLKLTAFMRVDGTTPDCGTQECPFFAALTLTAASDQATGERLSADLSITLGEDGSLRIEGGALGVRREPAGTIASGVDLRVTLSLSPGVDPEQGPALFAEIDFFQQDNALSVHVDRVPLMPLSDLLGAEAGCEEADGLFLAWEGAGSQVTVPRETTASRFQCANPNQLHENSREFDVGDSLSACGMGGLGAPALQGYCRGDDETSCEPRWELWADGTDEERAVEEFEPRDFRICSAAASNDTSVWSPRVIARGGAGISAREPSVLVVTDENNVGRGNREVYVAWSEREPGSDRNHILRFSPKANGAQDFPESMLDITVAGCESLRHPALVAPDHTDSTRLWLFFTCDLEDSDISHLGSLELEYEDDTWSVVSGSENPNLLPNLGSYGSRGSRAAEVIAERDADRDDVILRMWFLARDGDGNLSLAYAQAQGPLTGGVPIMVAFPGNPIADARSRVFGADSCGLDCNLESLGVSRQPRVGDPDFQLLIARRRHLADNMIVHELIPLLQPRPR